MICRTLKSSCQSSKTPTPRVKKEIRPGRHILSPAGENRFVGEFQIEEELSSSYSLMTWRVTAPLFKYQGRKQRTLKLHLSLSAEFEKVQPQRVTSRVLMASQVVVGLRTPDGDQYLWNSHDHDNGRLNLWESRQLTAHAFAKLGMEIPIEVGKTPDRLDKYDLFINFFVHHELEKRGRDKQRSSARVRLDINDLSFSWV